MGSIIRYTLLTAMRDWLFVGLLAIVLMAYGLSAFMGGTALTEQLQMSIAYFAGSSRIVLVIGLIVFICFHVRRGFENREIESMLSKPLSRAAFVIAYWFGFALLAVIATVPILVIVDTLNPPDIQGVLYWGASLVMEVSVIVAFAMLSSLILSSAVSSVLSCFAFYLISRLMGFFLAAIEQPVSLMGAGEYGGLMKAILKVISVIIPRLDLFAKSEWLIYGMDGVKDLWVFPLQSLIYVPLLLSVAVFDFKRKQF